MSTSNRLAEILSVMLLLVLFGCGKTTDKTNKFALVLKPDLREKEISYKKLFSGCEIIEIETNVECLLSNIDKMICKGDSIYIFDMHLSNLYLFSSDGKFLNKIGERGQGPEEYIQCYDFSLYPNSDIVSMLSPYGEIINYHNNGKYSDRKKLPDKPNYFACSWINSKEIALWSAMDMSEPGLTVYDVDAEKIVCEDWYNDRMLDMTRLNPFFQNDQNLFFAAPMSFSVYEFKDKSFEKVYEWDLNNRFISEGYIQMINRINNQSEKNDRLISDMETGELICPFFNGENERYYYISLLRGIGEKASAINILYEKSSGKSLTFQKLSEGISIYPLFMNEDYLLCLIPYNEVNTYNKLFNKNLVKSEDENPLVARFYFK